MLSSPLAGASAEQLRDALGYDPPIEEDPPEAKPGPKHKPSPRKITFTDEQITSALTACHGLMNPAAKTLGVGVDCLRKNLKPQHIQLIAEQREAITDAAEAHLFMGIQRGDPRTVEFWLKYQGKTRGYSEKQEVRLEGQVTTEDAAKRRSSIQGLLAKLRSKDSGANGSV